MPHTPLLLKKYAEFVALAKAQGGKIVTAESCTGGLISSLFTEIAGSSAVFERGFVTYSNESKHEMLGVPLALIEAHGAVSAEVAQAMAQGALKNSHADYSVSVTGIAGPDGGSAAKPVGTVYIASATKNAAAKVEHHLFEGNRTAVREQTAKAAIKLLAQQLSA